MNIQILFLSNIIGLLLIFSELIETLFSFISRVSSLLSNSFSVLFSFITFVINFDKILLYEFVSLMFSSRKFIMFVLVKLLSNL